MEQSDTACEYEYHAAAAAASAAADNDDRKNLILKGTFVIEGSITIDGGNGRKQA